MAQKTFRGEAALVLSLTIAGATIAGTTGAGAEERLVIDVPAQALGRALAELSDETALQVSVRSDLVAGKTSAAVQGMMTPTEALQVMLAGTGLAPSALGQDGVVITASQSIADEGPIMLDQIVVEGELQTRTLQESQTSVAVITGELLERRSDKDLNAIAERTPGVTTSFNTDFAIRGVTSGGPSFDGGAATVTTVVDGARVSNLTVINNTNFSTWDLEQVEVLRGPQSTQTGRNALAGAVVVRSADPTYDQEFKLRAGAGNGDFFSGSFAANLPVIDETVALRLSADIERFDGFTENLTLLTDDQDKNDTSTFRAGLRLDPIDDFSAVFKFTAFRSEQGSFEGIAGSEFPDRRATFNDFPEFYESDLLSGNARLSYDFSDRLSIASETTYFTTDSKYDFDFDSTEVEAGIGERTEDGSSFEQELRLVYDGERVRAVLGGFYTRIKSDVFSGAVSPATLLAPTAPPGVTIDVSADSTNDITNYAAFAEVEAEVYGGLSVIAGFRYDREEAEETVLSTIETNFPPFLAFLPEPGLTETSATYDAWLPKAGFIYDFTDDLSLGFTFQRGYRAGGARLNVARAELVEFDPEFTNNYEVALRSEWFDRRLTVNANAFFTQFRDQQVNVILSDFPNDFEIQNAGQSRSFGGELDIRATPLPGLEVFGGLAYVDTEFQDFVSNGEQLGGNEFALASKWTASFGAEYSFENGIFLGADASYTSGAFSDAQNTPSARTDSRFLVNTRLGYETERFSVFAFADNIFDKDYTVFQAAEATRVANFYAGPPRTFGVIAQIRF